MIKGNHVILSIKKRFNSPPVPAVFSLSLGMNWAQVGMTGDAESDMGSSAFQRPELQRTGWSVTLEIR